MNKVAHWIVKKRVLILVLAILLLIPAAIGYFSTFVNYDILSYLPDDLDSMKGQTYLEDDFDMASTAMLVVDKLEPKQVQELKEKIVKVDGVKKVLWVDDVMDITVPKEMLPEDFQNFFYSDTGTMMLINFEGSTASAETHDAIKEIKSITTKECFLGGMSAIVQDTRDLADKETPLYVVIAVVLAVVVLALGMESTFIPLIFMLGIIFPIVYNFGTNFFLGQISYITKALAAVLQLGVTMDFSIFLLHRYEEEKQKFTSREDAMASAISATFSSITGSSLTTVAGFLALCAMRLLLGRDIGIVMAKGVVLGVICTLTVLPALIMFFDKPIERFRHKTLIRELKKTPAFIVQHYRAFLVGFLILIIPFAYGQLNNKVYYALDESLPKDLPSIIGTNKLKDDFNMTTTHFILVDEKLDNYQIKQMCDQIEKVDGVDTVIAYEKYIGGRIPGDIEPEAIKDVLQQGGKKMLVANSAYKAASNEETAQIDQINSIIKSYDKSAVVTGEGALTKDLIQIADVDFKSVNVVSIIAIFLIIAVCFKSLSIPVLLVAAIEFAITINMGLPFYTGTTLPFIAGIVIGTIQLGATVDYAILMTTRFREERRNGLDVKAAMTLTIQKCSTSIITSGLTFFAANIGVACISQIDLIRSLCGLMARGAIISMLVILFVLPSFLILCDKLIVKTSVGWLKIKSSKGVMHDEKAH